MHTFSKFQTVGRLTKDVELPEDENRPVFFIVAVNDGYKNRETGEWVEKTNFIPVQSFDKSVRKLAENGHMTKGRAFLIEGRVEQNEYEDKDTGKKIKGLQLIAEGPIRFMDSKKEG